MNPRAAAGSALLQVLVCLLLSLAVSTCAGRSLNSRVHVANYTNPEFTLRHDANGDGLVDVAVVFGANSGGGWSVEWLANCFNVSGPLAGSTDYLCLQPEGAYSLPYYSYSLELLDVKVANVGTTPTLFAFVRHDNDSVVYSNAYGSVAWTTVAKQSVLTADVHSSDSSYSGLAIRPTFDVADMDGDGFVDVVMAADTGLTSTKNLLDVGLWAGDGTGGFTRTETSSFASASSGAYSLLIADVEYETSLKPEALMRVNPSSAAAQYLIRWRPQGSSATKFASIDSDLKASGVLDFDAGDLGGGDSTADVAVCSFDGAVEVWMAGTPWTLSYSYADPEGSGLVSGKPRASRCTLADINGDGELDLVHVRRSPDSTEHLVWHRSWGDGNISAPTPLVSDSPPGSLTLGSGQLTFADLDGDGDADFVWPTGGAVYTAENCGPCSCSTPDYDTDSDGVLLCNDVCVGEDDGVDTDGDGTPDCIDNPPVALASFNTLVATIDSVFYHNFAAHFTDPDGDILSITARFVSGPLPNWLAIPGGALSGTPSSGDEGAFELIVRAADSSGNYVEIDGDFLVVAEKNAPVVIGTLPNQRVRELETWAYTVPGGVFVDPDGSDMVLSAAARLGPSGNYGSLPGWMDFWPSNDSFAGNPPLTSLGSYYIQVTATDLTLLNVSFTFILTVDAFDQTYTSSSTSDTTSTSTSSSTSSSSSSSTSSSSSSSSSSTSSTSSSSSTSTTPPPLTSTSNEPPPTTTTTDGGPKKVVDGDTDNASSGVSEGALAAGILVPILVMSVLLFLALFFRRGAQIGDESSEEGKGDKAVDAWVGGVDEADEENANLIKYKEELQIEHAARLKDIKDARAKMEAEFSNMKRKYSSFGADQAAQFAEYQRQVAADAELQIASARQQAEVQIRMLQQEHAVKQKAIEKDHNARLQEARAEIEALAAEEAKREEEKAEAEQEAALDELEAAHQRELELSELTPEEKTKFVSAHLAKVMTVRSQMVSERERQRAAMAQKREERKAAKLAALEKKQAAELKATVAAQQSQMSVLYRSNEKSIRQLVNALNGVEEDEAAAETGLDGGNGPDGLSREDEMNELRAQLEQEYAAKMASVQASAEAKIAEAEAKAREEYEARADALQAEQEAHAKAMQDQHNRELREMQEEMAREALAEKQRAAEAAAAEEEANRARMIEKKKELELKQLDDEEREQMLRDYQNNVAATAAALNAERERQRERARLKREARRRKKMEALEKKQATERLEQMRRAKEEVMQLEQASKLQTSKATTAIRRRSIAHVAHMDKLFVNQKLTALHEF